MDNPSERTGWISLIVILAVTFTASAIGSQFPPDAWYRNLQEPSFKPPDAVFAPVWTVLYALMAIAAWLVWRRRPISNVAPALVAYGVQLALNAVWSWLFFGRHAIGIALVDIALLWVAIVVTIILFWRIRAAAGALLLPYFAWVSFAAVLNAAFWQLNA